MPIVASREMHRHLGKSDPQLLTILQGSTSVGDETNVGRKLVMFFAALIVAGALISAWLLSHG